MCGVLFQRGNKHMGYVRTYRRKDGTIVRGHYRRNKYSGSARVRNYYSSDVYRYKQDEQLTNVHLQKEKDNCASRNNNVSRSIIDMLKESFWRLFKRKNQVSQNSKERLVEISTKSEEASEELNNKEAISVLEDMPNKETEIHSDIEVESSDILNIRKDNKTIKCKGSKILSEVTEVPTIYTKEMVEGYQRLVNILYEQIKDQEVVAAVRNSHCRGTKYMYLERIYSGKELTEKIKQKLEIEKRVKPDRESKERQQK